MRLTPFVRSAGATAATKAAVSAASTPTGQTVLHRSSEILNALTPGSFPRTNNEILVWLLDAWRTEAGKNRNTGSSQNRDTGNSASGGN